MENDKAAIRADKGGIFAIMRKIALLNRRRTTRYTIDNDRVKCECLFSDSGQEFKCPVNVINISATGLILTAEKKIYPGTELKMLFKINSVETPVIIFGHVIRTYRKLNQQIYHSAVKFESAEEEQIKLIITE